MSGGFHRGLLHLGRQASHFWPGLPQAPSQKQSTLISTHLLVFGIICMVYRYLYLLWCACWRRYHRPALNWRPEPCRHIVGRPSPYLPPPKALSRSCGINLKFSTVNFDRDLFFCLFCFCFGLFEVDTARTVLCLRQVLNSHRACTVRGFASTSEKNIYRERERERDIAGRRSLAFRSSPTQRLRRAT